MNTTRSLARILRVGNSALLPVLVIVQDSLEAERVEDAAKAEFNVESLMQVSKGNPIRRQDAYTIRCATPLDPIYLTLVLSLASSQVQQHVILPIFICTQGPNAAGCIALDTLLQNIVD